MSEGAWAVSYCQSGSLNSPISFSCRSSLRQNTYRCYGVGLGALGESCGRRAVRSVGCYYFSSNSNRVNVSRGAACDAAGGSVGSNTTRSACSAAPAISARRVALLEQRKLISD